MKRLLPLFSRAVAILYAVVFGLIAPSLRAAPGPSLEFATNTQGLTSLVYNGWQFIDRAPGASGGGRFLLNPTFNASFRAADGTVGPDTKFAGTGTTYDEATRTVTVAFAWGSVSCSYQPAGDDRLNLVLHLTNTSADTLVTSSGYLTTLWFPLVNPNATDVRSGVYPLGGVPRSQDPASATPAIAVDLGSYGTLAVCTDSRAPALHGTGNWTPYNSDRRFRLDANFREVAPGTTARLDISLRFSPHQVDLPVIAADVFAKDREDYPMLLDWPDRRYIGANFIASVYNGANPKNPSGWFNNNNTVDVTTPEGVEAFRTRLLAFADATITNLRAMNAQGIITWDIEGQRAGPVYYGAPNRYAELSPEMAYVGPHAEDTATAYMRRLREAGFLVGVCVRPETLLPPAPGSIYWTQQSHGTDQAAMFTVLEGKIAFAKERWGCRLFYIDSDYDVTSATYRALHLAHPDVLLIPEWNRPRHYAYAAPYESFQHHGVVTTGRYSRALYPGAFTLLHSDASNTKFAESFDALVGGASGGDVFISNAWYASSAHPQIRSILAAATPGRPWTLADRVATTAGNPLRRTLPALGLLANDQDRATPPAGLTSTLVTPPQNGAVTVFADGTYVYQPAPGFTGADRFTYRATNAAGSEDAAVLVNVEPTPRAVAHWRFDAAASGFTLAGSANPEVTLNNGLRAALGAGASVAPDGRVGPALRLTGAAAGVSVSDSPYVDGALRWTLAAWVRPANLDSPRRVLLAKLSADDAEHAFALAFDDDGRLQVDLAGTADRFATAGVFANGAWRHLAVVFDGTLAPPERVRVYLDGVLDTTAASSVEAIPATAADLWLGQADAADTTTRFGGDLDDLRIYRDALPLANVRQLAQVDPPVAPDGFASVALGSTSTRLAWSLADGASDYRVERSLDGLTWTNVAELDGSVRTWTDANRPPVGTVHYRVTSLTPGALASVPSTFTDSLLPFAHWRFADLASDQAADASGNAFHFALAGAPTRPAGKVGSALALDGATQAGQLAATFPATETFSFALWLRPSALGTVQTVFAKQVNPPSNPAFRLRLNANRSLECSLAFDANRFTYKATFTEGTWYHVAGVYDGTLATAQRLRLYVNGVLDSTISVNQASLAESAQPLFLGQNFASDTTRFAGAVDDLRLYRRLLDESDIRRLAQIAAPVAPDRLTVARVSPQTATIAWASADGAATYRVERRAWPAGDWAPLVTLDGDTLAHTDSAAPAGVEVAYRVVALSPGGEAAPTPASPAAPSFAGWRAATFTTEQLAAPSVSGDLADPDADGASNFLEYALARDPLAPEPPLSDLASPSPNSGYAVARDPATGRLALTFRRARAELTYVVEACANLAAPAGSPSGWQILATNPGAVGKLVTVPDTLPAAPGDAPPPRRFLRLRVTSP